MSSLFPVVNHPGWSQSTATTLRLLLMMRKAVVQVSTLASGILRRLPGIIAYNATEELGELSEVTDSDDGESRDWQITVSPEDDETERIIQTANFVPRFLFAIRFLLDNKENLPARPPSLGR